MLTAVGLGGNLGGAAAVIARFAAARAALEGHAGVVGRMSSWYRSAPLGPVAAQPGFVNAVLVLPWQPADPTALLAVLQAIEAGHGRARAIAQGPRTLDLDLLLVGGQTIATAGLTVPHPALATRRFVLAPLAELVGPGFVLPDGRTLAGLLADPAIAAQVVERLG